LIIYAIPFLCIAAIYFRVCRFLRNEAKSNKELLIRKCQYRQRDMLVLRRITILVILLGSYGLPTSIMLILLAITHELASCFYRFLILSAAACVLTQSLTLIYITPHFRRNILFFQRTKTISQNIQAKNNGRHSNSSNYSNIATSQT
jgi:hypothetical protein